MLYYHRVSLLTKECALHLSSLFELANRELPTTISIGFIAIGAYNLVRPLFSKYILARQTAIGWLLAIAGTCGVVVFNSVGAVAVAAGYIGSVAFAAAVFVAFYALDKAAERKQRNKQILTRP